MTSVVAGATILAFTLLKAGEALLPLLGRERNDVFDLAWPLSLWITWSIALFALVPATSLVEEAERSMTLGMSVAAVSLVFGIRLTLTWRRMRAS